MFGVAEVLRPCDLNGCSLAVIRVLIVLEMLLFANEAPEVLSVCLFLIFTSPQYFSYSFE